MNGEVGESLDCHASSGFELDRIINGDSVVEPHEPDNLLAVGEEEEA